MVSTRNSAAPPRRPRSKAAIELVNLTKHPIDVKLGYGAGRIEAGKSLLVRFDAGEQPLEVSSPGLPGESLAGPLKLQKGHAYAVGIAWQEVLVGDAPAMVPASPKSAAAGKAQGEPAPVAKTQTQAAGKKGPSWNKSKKKSGRVDIGRKRKKDR